MECVHLVETAEKDYEEYYKIRSSASDIYWNGYLDKPDYKEFKKVFLARTCKCDFSKADDRRIYLIQNDRKINIGFVQLIWRDNSIEIGYSIIDEYQGNGYATQALKAAIPIAKKYFDDVIVRIRDDNIASQHVAIKCGFSRTEIYIETEYPNVGIIKLRTYVLPNTGKAVLD
jgi:RimJ/RimL family protein N-acetyltransferase